MKKAFSLFLILIILCGTAYGESQLSNLMSSLSQNNETPYTIGNLTYRVPVDWTTEYLTDFNGYMHKGDGNVMTTFFYSFPCNITNMPELYSGYQQHYQKLVGSNDVLPLIMGISNGYLTALYSYQTTESYYSIWTMIDGQFLYSIMLLNPSVDHSVQDRELNSIVETVSIETEPYVNMENALEEAREKTDMANIRAAFADIVANALIGESVPTEQKTEHIMIQSTTGPDGELLSIAYVTLVQAIDGWQSDIELNLGNQECNLGSLDVGAGKTVVLTYSLDKGLTVDIL